MSESRLIEFTEIENNETTRVWIVQTNHKKTTLGRVFWYGFRRNYCFFPWQLTVFDCKFLRDIAAFCEEKTKEHREAKHGKPA